MINQVYQLVSPKTFSVEYKELTMGNHVVVRPNYLALCHADQRYFLGSRSTKILKKKLPMALVHEACGTVVYDPTNTFAVGTKVVLIPNVPGEFDGEIYENYAEGSQFLSSGHDGFMREFVDLPPDRLVPYTNVADTVAAISEFVSVGVHATSRFDQTAHHRRKSIGIWGDGSMGYSVACILNKRFPDSDIYVVGRDERKLDLFTFAAGRYLSDSLPLDFQIDHGFECCGGEGSYYAINDMIDCMRPQGSMMLLGVSENKIAINTRDILEKGLTVMGSSRSGRQDFEMAIHLLEQKDFEQRLKKLVWLEGEVSSLADINRVFAADLTNPFKTVFHWNL